MMCLSPLWTIVHAQFGGWDGSRSMENLDEPGVNTSGGSTEIADWPTGGCVAGSSHLSSLPLYHPLS